MIYSDMAKADGRIIFIPTPHRGPVSLLSTQCCGDKVTVTYKVFGQKLPRKLRDFYYADKPYKAI